VEPLSARFDDIPACNDDAPLHAYALQRRKKQNRESQRAFRARERTRVQKLEERLRTLTQQYRELEQAYSHLKNNSKRHLEEIDVKEEVTESCIPL
jgi:hypothetical protein